MKTFHIPTESWGEPWSLTGAEAHHLSRVLRLGPGAVVRCMDGHGRYGEFRVEAVSKQRADLTPLDLREAPEPRPRVVLALAWTKGLRRGWLLEKAVEFSATELWFWQAARSQGDVPDDPKETWEAKLLAGAKQCGNPRLPVVRTMPGGAAEVAREAAASPARYLLHEDREAGAPLTAARVESTDDVVCVLGPEGGFAPGEAETLMDAGFAPVSLGPGVLRWETAALLALGLFWWGGGRA
ncbi:16S rRNA (uracil(1498)-N(3))-methyltransferase [Desulfocurvus sp. DL9XJH121]